MTMKRRKDLGELLDEGFRRDGWEVIHVEPAPLGRPRKRRAKATSHNGKTRGGRAKR